LWLFDEEADRQDIDNGSSSRHENCLQKENRREFLKIYFATKSERGFSANQQPPASSGTDGTRSAWWRG